MTYSRKDFIKTLGAASLGIGLYPDGKPLSSKPMPGISSLKLGLASYTLRALPLDQMIAACARLNLKHLACKSMHMPLESSREELSSIRKKVTDAGINLYGAGVVYMPTEEQVEQAFSYAQYAGLSTIIGVPAHELLPLVEKKVKSTDIKIAIHNHGPGDKLYSSVDHIYDKIKNLDPRIGYCIDIGHVVRINEDPIEKIKKYRDRLYDIHLKDVDQAAAEGKSVEFGRGIIDFPAVLKTLREINYLGVMAIEFEKDEKDPLPGLAECVGYANGLLRMME